MTAPGARRPSRRVLPRRSVRARLTVLYSGLFLLSGVVLLAITGGVGASVSSVARANSATQGGTQPPQPEAATIHAAVSHSLLVGSAVALGVMTVASLVLGWIVAGRVLRPLREMTVATQRISEDNLHERLAMPGPADELTDLGDTINGLLERLEGAFGAQRRFVANAAHELRTPLTTMRACVDVAVAKPEPVPGPTVALAGRLRTELDRVDRLLDGFLVLARAQHGDLAGQATLSLEYVVSAALAVRAEAIAARRLTVHHASGRDGTWVRGSQALLCRMADNVIDNAITHNTDGGWLSRSGGSAPTGLARTTAPGSGCPSWRPSPRPIAAPWTCRPGREAACASPSRCPWPRRPSRRVSRHEGPGRGGLPVAGRRPGRGPARPGHGRRCRPRRPGGRGQARGQRLQRRGTRPRPAGNPRRHPVSDDHRAGRPGHGAHADRGQRARGAGQRPGPGCRRLPGQAVPFPRACRAHLFSRPPPAVRPRPDPARGGDRA